MKVTLLDLIDRALDNPMYTLKDKGFTAKKLISLDLTKLNRQACDELECVLEDVLKEGF